MNLTRFSNDTDIRAEVEVRRGSDEVEFDSNAKVSRDEKGYTGLWVQAWLWFDYDEIEVKEAKLCPRSETE